MFYPRSIAVVGASDQADKFSGRVLKHLIKSEYKGAIFPVNPNREVVQGIKCFASVRDIPDPIDVAVVMVPNSPLFQAPEECRARAVRGAIDFDSGILAAAEEGKRQQ